MSNDEARQFDGGCSCRTLRYRMTARPLFVHCCHCSWCQRESGSAFAHNALVEATHVVLLQGTPDVVHTPSHSGAGQKISRCPQCRVALWSNYADAGDAVRFVRVGTLDRPQYFAPDVHIYTSSKQPWVLLPPEVPTFAEYYERALLWPESSLRRLAALQARATT